MQKNAFPIAAHWVYSTHLKLTYQCRLSQENTRMQRREFLKFIGAGAISAATIGCHSSIAAPSKPGKRPNILFLFTDDQAFSTVGALNNPDIKTPNMDRLVRMGTTFTHCFNQGAWHGAVCVASRAMLNTGRYVWQCGGDTCGDYPLWGETLGNAGYNTYMTGKWHNRDASLKRSFKTLGPTGGGMFGSKDTNAAENKKLGIVKDPYHRPSAGNSWSPSDETLTGHWRQHEGQIVHSSKLWADSAIDYLNNTAAPSDDPFFMYVAFHAPHDPRQSPQEFVDMYPPESIKIPKNYLPEHPFDQGDHKLRDEVLAPFPRTKEAVQLHLSEYYAIISHADYHIGRILDALEKSGEADNTIIIFSADHGLACGQHGLLGKQNQYDHSVRMPLVFAGPGIEANKKLDTMVYLQSAFATTCEMTGVQAPDTVQFTSLVPILNGKKKKLYDSVYGCYRNMQRMVRTEKYKLIRYPHNGEVQLFDMVNDPHEITDLAENPKYAGTVKQLDIELRRWMKLTGDKLDLDNLPAEKKKKPSPVKPAKDGSLTLSPADATTTGTLRYQPDRNNLGGWTNPKDTTTWKLSKVKKGKYNLAMSYGSTNPGVGFTITAGDKSIAAKTTHTGGIKNYKQFDLGTITLPAGAVTLSIKPDKFTGAIMNYRKIKLTPIK